MRHLDGYPRKLSKKANAILKKVKIKADFSEEMKKKKEFKGKHTQGINILENFRISHEFLVLEL